MNIRAVIFDVYGTLLEVGPPPANADELWQNLCLELLGQDPPLNRLGFSIACNRAIARQHEVARARDIRWPEVRWPGIVGEVIPAVAKLSQTAREEFLFRQIQTGHTTPMLQETAATLRQLKARACLVGIASNAQAYTLRELRESLAAHRLGMDVFEAALCFWSFEHGFSKPDPHVFQILSTRLAARGIVPSEILMVGDRFDNDVAPARLFGWQTWHLSPQGNGGWAALRAELSAVTSKNLS